MPQKPILVTSSHLREILSQKKGTSIKDKSPKEFSIPFIHGGQVLPQNKTKCKTTF